MFSGIALSLLERTELLNKADFCYELTPASDCRLCGMKMQAEIRDVEDAEQRPTPSIAGYNLINHIIHTFP